MPSWRKTPVGAGAWAANAASAFIRMEIYRDGAGKFHWKAWEQRYPHHSQQGVSADLETAKGEAGAFYDNHRNDVRNANR